MLWRSLLHHAPGMASNNSSTELNELQGCGCSGAGACALATAVVHIVELYLHHVHTVLCISMRARETGTLPALCGRKGGSCR